MPGSGAQDGDDMPDMAEIQIICDRLVTIYGSNRPVSRNSAPWPPPSRYVRRTNKREKVPSGPQDIVQQPTNTAASNRPIEDTP